MWVLIVILITGPNTNDSYEVGRYSKMTECFYAREELLIKANAYSGIPPINSQFVCVPTDYK